MSKSKRIELPILEPMYSTYQFHGPATAILASNPSIRNWYLNERLNLTCSRKFLNGFTTPELWVVDATWFTCPYIEQVRVSSRFIGGYINRIIRQMLDDGYYVAFENVDDYYVEGKSWYKELHVGHDGLICGYDQNDKTYCLFAYDSRWIYRKFWTSQQSLDKARVSMEKQGIYPNFVAIKAKEDVIEFSPRTVLERIKEYLDSDLEKYPFEGEDWVYGIIVHAFIAEYIAKLENGDIPYERMDRRIFRMLWEHKKSMLERITLIENSLGLGDELSKAYGHIVHNAETIRALFAAHHMRRRDSVLPVIRKMVLQMMLDERSLLEQLVDEMERKFKNESVGISEE